AGHWSSRQVPSRLRGRPPSQPCRTVRRAEIAKGSADARAAARQRTHPSLETELIVGIGLERFVDTARRHVEPAAGTVEKTAHAQQSILRAACEEIERWSAAERKGAMRRRQPLDAGTLIGKKNAERLVDAQNRGNPQQHVHIQRDGLMLAHSLAPVVIGGSGRKAQDQKALFFRQAPEVRDR